MKQRVIALALGFCILGVAGCIVVKVKRGGAENKTLPPAVLRPSHDQEVHLSNVRQLTFAGENAEAYLSPDG